MSGEADGLVRADVSNAFLSCDSSIPVLLTGPLQVVWGIRIWPPLRNEGQAGQRQGVQVVSHVWCLEGGAGGSERSPCLCGEVGPEAILS